MTNHAAGTCRSLKRLRQVEELYHAALRAYRGRTAARSWMHACAGNESLTPGASVPAERARPRGRLHRITGTRSRSGSYMAGRRAVHGSGSRSAATGSSGRWAPAEWEKSIVPRTRGWTGKWRSRFCLPVWPTIPSALTRFKREAQAVAALSHPNILALHDFDFDRETHFAVMELLEGERYRKRLARSPMDWREAAEVAIAVADGLAAAHKKGIVHRDIKPANIFLTADGQVKILDFGIARMRMTPRDATQTQATLPGLAIGTVGYMAPEQLRGEPVEASADLFSLGCVLHEMVTGERAFAT